MCADHIVKNKRYFNNFFIYTVVVLLGICSGYFNIPVLKDIGIITSDVFIKIFKLISLPIIALSLIVTIAGASNDGTMKTIWQKTVLYTIITTIIAASVSCLLYLVINPDNVNGESPEIVSNLSSTNYFKHLSDLIPANIFAPFIEHQVMGVLLVGILTGLAIRFIPDIDAKNIVTNFFKGIHGIFLVITKWVVKIIPLALFGFITVTAMQLKEGMDFSGIGEYLLVVVLANLIQGFIVLTTWLKLNNIAPFKAMQGMMPALSVAFFSKSSAGTLPITIETSEKNLGVNPRISRFVLPLCTTINMNGCAAFIFTTVIYLMQNNGVEISLWNMVLWIFISTIAAVGNAGVPMGCFFLSASLLSSMNIPITLLGLILPFYSIIDMIETALNVWSDSCVAKVVNEKLKYEIEE